MRAESAAPTLVPPPPPPLPMDDPIENAGGCILVACRVPLLAAPMPMGALLVAKFKCQLSLEVQRIALDCYRYLVLLCSRSRALEIDSSIMCHLCALASQPDASIHLIQIMHGRLTETSLKFALYLCFYLCFCPTLCCRFVCYTLYLGGILLFINFVSDTNRPGQVSVNSWPPEQRDTKLGPRAAMRRPNRPAWPRAHSDTQQPC